ncbi:hypothetical protein, partial [Ellagibacter isourolithinifaciens]|uniref:hypothetical protein n=1 Tax=Ellagibacter isourolithinifaciens TaxID=2137581 RepID=UPI002E76163D
WYDFHCGRRLSLESDLSLSQILGDGHIRFTAASMRCGPYTNISDVIGVTAASVVLSFGMIDSSRRFMP